MAVEKTVAVVGIQSGNRSVFLEKLMDRDFLLLIIPKTEDERIQLSYQLQSRKTKAEVEVLDCARSGCWEADIIAFLDASDFEEGLLNRIQEVAVQKLVLCVLEGNSSKAEKNFKSLQKLLPYSQVMKVQIEPNTDRVFVSGGNEEAEKDVFELLKRLDLH